MTPRSAFEKKNGYFRPIVREVYAVVDRIIRHLKLTLGETGLWIADDPEKE